MKTCVRIKDGREFPYVLWTGDNTGEIKAIFDDGQNSGQEVVIYYGTPAMLEIEMWSADGMETFSPIFRGEFVVNIDGKPCVYLDRFFREEFYSMEPEPRNYFNAWLQDGTASETGNIEDVDKTFQRMRRDRGKFDEIENFLRGELDDLPAAPIEDEVRKSKDIFFEATDIREKVVLHEPVTVEAFMELEALVEGKNTLSGEFSTTIVDGVKTLVLDSLFIADINGAIVFECYPEDMVIIHNGEVVDVVFSGDY
jgi:hypothetical protein